MGFVQEHSKYYKVSLQNKFNKNQRPNFSINSKNPVFGPILVHVPNFGCKRKKKIKKYHCHVQLHIGIQHHVKNRRKTNDTIPRKHPDRQNDRWKNGQKNMWNCRRTDRPYFLGSFRLLPGIQKYSCSLYYFFLFFLYFPFNFEIQSENSINLTYKLLYELSYLYVKCIN